MYECCCGFVCVEFVIGCDCGYCVEVECVGWM